MIEVVGPDRLDEIGPAWVDLWDRVPKATAFQHPAWTLAWARVYAPGRCFASVAYRATKLTAVVPAFCWQGALLLAGTGPSDRETALFEMADCDGQAHLTALARALEPDRIDLQQISPHSPLARCPQLFATGAGYLPGMPCAVLDLNGPAATGKLKDSRYLRRRFEREGGAIEVCGEMTAGVLARLVDLHRLRQSVKGEPDAFDDVYLRPFLEVALVNLASAGLLRTVSLTMHQKMIGILLALRGRSAWHFYMSGFDPVVARFGPGTILIAEAIETARLEGAAWFDFLRGLEAYKFKWGAQEERLVNCVAALPTSNLAQGATRMAKPSPI